jgi:hypothetical protein
MFSLISLKSWSSDWHCPKFPLISNITLKVLVLRHTETQQQLPVTSSHQPTNHTIPILLQQVFYIQWQTRRWSNSSWEGE